MRLVKIGTLKKRKNGNSICKTLYRLISNGKIKGYKNQYGELMYDRDEYSLYRKTRKLGRPRKNEDELITVDTRKAKKCE